MRKLPRSVLRLTVAGFVLLVGWFAVFWLIGPHLLTNAYRGESFAFLNEAISGRGVHPLEFYLDELETRSWRVLGMAAVLGVIAGSLLLTRPELRLAPARTRPRRRVHSSFIAHCVIAATGLGLVLYLYFFYPAAYVYLTGEDEWGQYASFVGWAMACCFLAWLVVRDPAQRRPGMILLVLGAFFVAVEEISWGQRILGLPTPQLFLEHNLQGELNLHNLVPMQGARLPIGIALFVWSIVLPPLRSRLIWIRRASEALGVPVVPRTVRPYFLVTAALFVFSGLERSAEIAELFFAVSMAAFSLNLALDARRREGKGEPSPVLAGVGLIAVITLCAVGLVQIYSNPEQLRSYMNRFAAVRFPDAGMHQQAAMLFDFIERRPALLAHDTHFKRGRWLMEIGDHVMARKFLQLAIAEQQERERVQGGDSEGARNAAQALLLLDREEEAQVLFQEAIRRGLARLQDSKDPVQEAEARISLGLTLLASGDPAAAREQFTAARRVSPRSKAVRLLRYRIRSELGKEKAEVPL